MNNNIGYEPETIAEEELKNKPQKTTKKTNQLARLFNYFTLAIARENDLRTLCELRNYNVVGYRNTIIHIYAYQVLLIEKNKHIAKAKTEELNSKFNKPLVGRNIREVIETVYRAYQAHLKDRQKGYNYRNQTIIQKLEITEEEQKKMQTLISINEKRQRNYKKRKKNRRDKKGLTPKQYKKRERKMEVRELFRKGFNQTQIANKLGITRRTVYNDINLEK